MLPMNEPFPNADGGEDVPVGGFAPGVPGLEPGIGGSDSKSEAPKEDEGLNALRPLKPVICGLSVGDIEGAALPEVVVAPVGWVERDENMESENPELVVAVFCAFRNGNVPELALLSPALF